MDPIMIIMLVGMLGLLFFMQTRAKKQAKARDEFRTSLVPGQRVMTQGGLIGTIVAINEAADTLILDSAGSRCEYMRAGIAKTLDATVEAAPASPLVALGNLAGASASPPVDDSDLDTLDTITREYHESKVGTNLPKVSAVVEEK